MSISVFDIFSIGVGPSSSHTVGPMRAAHSFCQHLIDKNWLADIAAVRVDLYGSLALTGKGHGTDLAILNGLEGKTPEHVEPEKVATRAREILATSTLQLVGTHPIPFVEADHLLFHQKETLPLHSNGMRFTALASDGQIIFSIVYYSIGGGFIVEEEHFHDHLGHDDALPYPFASAAQLLEICQKHHLQIFEVMLANEKVWRREDDIHRGLLNIARVMFECIDKGCQHAGILPGGLNVKRRAPTILEKLQQNKKTVIEDKAEIMHWLNLYSLAVNEENAAGGRVVTAPTNGAAGIIPATLKYYVKFCHGSNDAGIINFLLTAGALAILYKKGASISAAEVGCQGEIGVACSMAAGALTAVLGGTIFQIENAAEIGMEHHLGLTCDPIAGLVQIPCIERNAMGTVQAINATQLALMGEGEHKVSLDTVIATMLQTGRDMKTQYKETSLGGLAVNLPEC